jgi:hypothetical protein
MPELLPDGLPQPRVRSKYDFSEWADGQTWKFVRGADYDSSTATFRSNVRRWAKAHGFAVECRPYPAEDGDGRVLAATKSDPVALAVRFASAVNGSAAAPTDRDAGSTRAPVRA